MEERDELRLELLGRVRSAEEALRQNYEKIAQLEKMTLDSDLSRKAKDKALELLKHMEPDLQNAFNSAKCDLKIEDEIRYIEDISGLTRERLLA